MSKLIRGIRKCVCRISPVVGSKIMYRKIMGKPLRLNPPSTFKEKIEWLKLYKWPNDPLAIQCADKLRVRDYVSQKGCAQYLNELYAYWDSVEDIVWDMLPQQFVMKCNHGCGFNIICDCKDDLNIDTTKKRLNKWMHEDFSLVSGEMHYAPIKRKIICERYLGCNIEDYKFFCFDGVPKFFYISRNVNGDFHNMQADFFNLDGTKATFFRTDHQSLDNPPHIPKNLEEMLSLSSKLSEDFPFARIDLFYVGERIFFSEITLTPSAGQMPLSPEDADLELGKLIHL